MIRRPPARRAAAEAVCALGLVLLPWLLYGASLGLWWTEDDFFQVRVSAQHAPSEYFFDRAFWQRLPNPVLSPLLFSSYDADLALEGAQAGSERAPDPALFYGHQLLALGLAAAALYGLQRLWLRPPLALLGGALFLLGPLTGSLASLLGTRQYVEAIPIGALSAAAFVVAARREDGACWSPWNRWAAWGFAVASALLYLLACLGKEIAVPLPGVLALLPVATWRRRAALLVPHAVCLALYLGYRAWMLGTLVGGYGFVLRPGDWPTAAVALPAKAALALAGPSAWGALALAAVAACVALHAARDRRAAAPLVAGLLLGLLTVLPVSSAFEPRYALVPWVVLALALPPALHALAGHRPAGPGRRAVAVCGVALLGLTLLGNRAAWAAQLDGATRLSTEYRTLAGLAPGDFLRAPVGTPASLGAMRVFSRELLHDPVVGEWFDDDLFLCAPRTRREIRTLWRFDEGPGRLVEATGELPALRRRHCGSIRGRAPIEVSFRRPDARTLAWRLGPYGDGRWAFVLGEGRVRHEVPRTAAFYVGAGFAATLRVRYESPDGWVTYSDAIDLSPGAEPDWSRPARRDAQPIRPSGHGRTAPSP